MTCTMPPVKVRSCSIFSQTGIATRREVLKRPYGSNNCRTTAHATQEDIDVAGLPYPRDDLAASHIGVGCVLKPGLVEFEGAIVASGRMQSREDMVLQHGANDLALVRFERGAKGRVGNFAEGIVVGNENCDILLEGEVGIDVAIGRQEGGELAEILIGLQQFR